MWGAREASIRTAACAGPTNVGAAYDGVGLPACVATARSAASRVLEFLASRPVSSGDRVSRQ